MNRRIRVFAPATVANLGPGFDVLGLALSRPGDELEAELTDHPGIEIVEITGDRGLLSRDADKNVVGRAAADVLRRAGANRGVRLWLHKQMPLASGLGSSGASSAAGAVAVNELLGKPLAERDVVASAMEGERAASGTPHADNVAPSVMGGIVLVRSYQPFEVIALPLAGHAAHQRGTPALRSFHSRGAPPGEGTYVLARRHRAESGQRGGAGRGSWPRRSGFGGTQRRRPSGRAAPLAADSGI